MKLMTGWALTLAVVTIGCADQKSVKELSNKIDRTEDRILAEMDPNSPGHGAMISNQTEPGKKYGEASFSVLTEEQIIGFRVHSLDIQFSGVSELVTVSVSPVYAEGASGKAVVDADGEPVFVPTRVIMNDDLDVSSLSVFKEMLMDPSKVIQCRSLNAVNVAVDSKAGFKTEPVSLEKGDDPYNAIECDRVDAYLSTHFYERLRQLRMAEEKKKLEEQAKKEGDSSTSYDSVLEFIGF